MKTLKTVAAAILMVSFFSALSASVPEAKKEFGSAVTTMPPLTTKRPYLPRRQSGYAFVSNIEQIAYISAEQSSMIHFMPVNPSHKPKLFIALPPEVRLQGAFRDLAVEKAGKFSHGGKELDRYRINAGPRVAKYTFFWRLAKSLPEGTELQGFYWGEWSKGKQAPRPLKIKVVSIPAVKQFRQIPVYLSMPNDFYAEYPDTEGLRRSGFNYLDMWTYLTPDESDWGISLLDSTLAKTSKAGVGEIAWIREWWWHNGQKEADGMATLIDGKKVSNMLCLSYRGKWYQALIDQGKYLIDRGLYFHSTDPEMYGEGSKICFCESCKKRFGDYLKKKAADVAYEDPAIFEKNPEQYAELHRLWNAFKCWSYTEFFAEYRRAMEQYMKEKGISEPFRFMIYSSYHRSFPGFWQYEDYRKSHSYLMTLEDPQTFVGVFDFVAPMVYMDVYANYEDYDMLLPWRDTAVLRRITGDKVPISPILCAGYPFIYAFGSDLNAEMLKYNMLEVIGGGGKGFGFWGECPFDAADMKAVAEVVGMLAPYEKIILEGKAEGKVTVCSGNAVAKRVTSPAGSLLLVSEYSRRPLKVELECPVTERSRVIDLSTGRQIAEITETQPRFTLNLGKDRAVMLYIGR